MYILDNLMIYDKIEIYIIIFIILCVVFYIKKNI